MSQHFAVLTGTPNQTEVVYTSETYGPARKWALDKLDAMKADCRKYDSDGLAHIDDVITALKQAGQPTVEGFGWTFPWMGVTFRLQLKRIT